MNKNENSYENELLNKISLWRAGKKSTVSDYKSVLSNPDIITYDLPEKQKVKIKKFTDYQNYLLKLIEKHNLQGYESTILSIAKENIIVRTTEPDNYNKTGNTRFGGYPDLPKGYPWPKYKNKYLNFLCQINLKDIAGLQNIADTY